MTKEQAAVIEAAKAMKTALNRSRYGDYEKSLNDVFAAIDALDAAAPARAGSDAAEADCADPPSGGEHERRMNA